MIKQTVCRATSGGSFAARFLPRTLSKRLSKAVSRRSSRSFSYALFPLTGRNNARSLDQSESRVTTRISIGRIGDRRRDVPRSPVHPGAHGGIGIISNQRQALRPIGNTRPSSRAGTHLAHHRCTAWASCPPASNAGLLISIDRCPLPLCTAPLNLWTDRFSLVNLCKGFSRFQRYANT